MSQPLQGKVALVSGAGKNIGRAIALALARDGASIVVNGRADKAAVDGVVREIEAAGGKAMPAMGDVGDPAVPPRLAAEAAARFGGVDILVSNAGLAAPDLVPRHVLRGMARDHVGGARRRLPAGQGDHPADGGAGRRRLRGAVRHLDPYRHAQPLPRLGLQVGPRRADACARRRARAAQDHLQRALARRHRHRRAPPPRGRRRPTGSIGRSR